MTPHQELVQLSSGAGLVEAHTARTLGPIERSRLWGGYLGVFYCAKASARKRPNGRGLPYIPAGRAALPADAYAGWVYVLLRWRGPPAEPQKL